MSGFIPTTRVRLLERSESADSYGDPTDVYARGRKSVPAHIAEKRARVPDPSTGVTTIVVNYLALLPGNLEIERGTRMLDLKDQIVYVVERVRKRNSFVAMGPLRVELQLVT